jgi:hypothetical protein
MTPRDERTRVRHLLEELCTELGFCSAARDPMRFLALVAQGADEFADAVLSAEGLDPKSEKRLASQVQSLVRQHFTAWHTNGAA